MAVAKFDNEGAEFADYIAANVLHALIRVPNGIIVITGSDLTGYVESSALPRMDENYDPIQ